MRDVRYMISEASKLVDVEQHTLRYWEDELELEIPRNEMGHRYYMKTDIELLKAIKVFKNKGYQLRAIKMLIPEIQQKNLSTSDDIEELQKTYENRNIKELTKDGNLNKFTGNRIGPSSIQATSNSSKQEVYHNVNGENSIDKLEKFRTIMKSLLMEVLADNNDILTETMNEEVSNSIIKEMNHLLRIKEEQEEQRYKDLDRTIREVQNAREEASATSSLFKRKKKAKFFSRNS